MVREELTAEPSAVYKLSGRVLVKQDVSDARSTVTRRLEYIQAEMCVAPGE
jgi:chaperonin cofactor prefoldin